MSERLTEAKRISPLERLIAAQLELTEAKKATNANPFVTVSDAGLVRLTSNSGVAYYTAADAKKAADSIYMLLGEDE